MTSFRIRTVVAMTSALALLACQGDKPEAAPSDDPMARSLELWKERQRIADSVVKAAPSVKEVADKLGASMYHEADAELTAAVLKEAEKTSDCYTNTLRDVDPGLTAVFYVLVNFGLAGWDLVRVENWEYSSPAGGKVMACINARAKSEWKLPTKGIKPGAHLVKLVYTPPDSSKRGR